MRQLANLNKPPEWQMQERQYGNQARVSDPDAGVTVTHHGRAARLLTMTGMIPFVPSSAPWALTL